MENQVNYLNNLSVSTLLDNMYETLKSAKSDSLHQMLIIWQEFRDDKESRYSE